MEILERTDQLGQLHDYLRQAEAGEGKLVLLGGESGIGKSTLIRQFVSEAPGVVRGVRAGAVSCDGLKMPGPLGPLFEIAQVLGPEVERLLDEEAPRDRLFRGVYTALAQSPGVLVLVGEDAHWTDEASLDLVQFLGRRVGSLRLLFIVTFRDDELGPYHPLRRVLGELATAPAVRRMTLSPLSLAAVTELAQGTGVDPVALHGRTGGNPFYVTEVLATGKADVPETVRDAVLARAARLSPEGRAVLDAAAAIGMIVDPGLLEAVIGGPIADAVEECMEIGTLLCPDKMIVFRHGIARSTILESISPPRYRALHRRILAAMQADPAFRNDLPHLAHHAEEAGDRETVLRVAPAAARRAAVFGAHREAAAQYARALRFAGDLPLEERAELLEARSRECYLTGQIEDMIQAGQEARSLLQELGNRIKLGDITRWLSRLMWFAGRGREAEVLAVEALRILEPLPAGPELAMAYSNLSQLRMLSDDVPAAVEWGERAIALATELGQTSTLINALTNVGTAKLRSEDERGRALIERGLDLAREAGLEDDVARALTNLGWAAFGAADLEAAERYISDGLMYTGDRDLLAMERYLQSLRAGVRFAQGAWEATAVASMALVNDPVATLPTRIMALKNLGRVQACRGEDATATLDEALELAERTGELQRLGPVRSARAEAAWLAGDHERMAAEARIGLDLALSRANRRMAGEFMLWLCRAGQPVSPGDVPEPFALELAGDWAGAAACWDAVGYPLEAARARSEGGDEAAVREALATFDRLGARPDAARASRRLRALGATRIPRGPRAETRVNPALLTQREVEVLALVAAGRSNREIAERLYLSPKTAGHHVSAILAKLGAANRADAAEHARQIGLLPTTGP